MMSDAVSRRAHELAAEGTAFVTATVVRAQRPTSVKAGDVALVLADGTIEGFVGGVCAQQSVRVYSLKAIETEEALLLRIVPDGPIGEDPGTGQEVSVEDGTATAHNPCLSGGAMEIFLEPVLPEPRVLVVGDTPIAEAVRALGADARARADRGRRREPRARGRAISRWSSQRTGATSCTRCGAGSRPAFRTSASSRATSAARASSTSFAPTVSPRSSSQLIDVPAGLDIGARAPAEIALSILAKIVAVRRGKAFAEVASADAPAPVRATGPAPAKIAIDPICGMTVAAVASTPSVEHDGETVYFCCEGCKTKFIEQTAAA